MSLIVLGSAKGSPGVTRFAHSVAAALGREHAGAHPGAVLVDGDADGGDLSFLIGLDPVPSVATLALEGRHGIDMDLLLQHAQRDLSLPGVAVLTGVPGRAQAALLEWLFPHLAALAHGCSIPFVVDVGRLAGGACRPLLEAADRVVVLCGTSTSSLVHTRSALGAVAAAGASPCALAIGPERESAADLADALGFPVLGPLSWGARDERGLEGIIASLREERPGTPPVAPVGQGAPPSVLGAALRTTRRRA
jgi:hypothetical protein